MTQAVTGKQAQTGAEEGERFPSSLLYAINTKIGAHGLGVPALETLKLSHAHGFLGKAVCWGNLSDAIPKELIRSLHSQPTRLLPGWTGNITRRSSVGRSLTPPGRNKQEGATIAFHGWSGEALEPSVRQKKRGLPTLLDIPTCHRDKGRRNRESPSESATFGLRQSPTVG